MTIVSNLGFPRIGVNRELKRAVESFWKGKIGEEELSATAAELRRRHWLWQRDAGIEHIPTNDFSFYDQMLDTIAMVGAVPPRFGFSGDRVDLPTYFAMARGRENATAMEMTKWFDTNYHYIVPEFEPDQTFRLASTKPIDEFAEARALGIAARPVLIGPITFLLLGKSQAPDLDPLSLLDGLLPVYEEVVARLADAGAAWIQIDEPVLATDLPPGAAAALETAYARLSAAAGNARLLLATYFGPLDENLPLALRLPVDAVHLDLVRAPEQLDDALSQIDDAKMLSLGVVDGRNIWRTDLDRALTLIERAAAKLGRERLLIGPSCSLLHSPIDLDMEPGLDAELKQWLAFARQKLDELALLGRAVNEGRDAVADALAASREAVEKRRTSPRVHNPAVNQRVGKIDASMMRRGSPYAQRREQQQANLNLPELPTTTIGSFPQTTEVRQARAARKKGQWTEEQYEQFCREEIERTVRFQESLDLDMLVHGECERNDMVEYFGEQLDGFAFTANGWVQSYGSRCVKPPVIFGDVSRPEPMTVGWSRYAQSLTSRPMKGMLTGPITILQWSFVRDDQPRRDTAMQIALAIRDEVVDLEEAGIRAIQIDEPAIREGLPLRRKDWA